MRIKSITVRNYRIHREVSVELDPGRTVIGGPNECGKTTLAEAAHRALFLKANITGEAQRTMVSTLHPGHPKVEVCFEAGGKAYQLLKRFSGQTGTARLSEIGGASWQDEAAEEELARVLRVELPGGGRGVADRVALQWAHLWVWQGQAGDDPAAHANAQRDTLMSRLQAAGGSAAMQSERDAQTARGFAERYASIFNKNGSPKRDSDLSRAMAQAQQAADSEENAREIFQSLQQSISDYEQAAAAIKNADQSLQTLRPQKEDVDVKLTRVADLGRDEQVQATETEAESGRYHNLLKVDQRIHDLRSEIQTRALALEPKNTETTRLNGLAQERRRQAELASVAYDQATEATRQARRHQDLAAAYVTLFEKTDQHNALARRADQVHKEKQARAALDIALAKLPSLDAKKFKKLQSLETDCSNAQAALRAMAARLEVLAAAEAVKAGHQIWSPGQIYVITEDTVLEIGPVTRLRISPGGGAGLTDARNQLGDAQKTLAAALDKLGLPSVEAAAEALASRQRMEGEIQTVDARLVALEADSIEALLSCAQQALSAARGEVDRRQDHAQGFLAPSDIAQAQRLTKTLAATLREKEAEERNLKAARDDAVMVSSKAEEDAVQQREALAKENSELGNLKVELDLLTRTQGEDVLRGQKLALLRAAKTKAEARLADTRKMLNELQPDLLNSDRGRLQRALEKALAEKEAAGRKLAVAGHSLASDGTADPAASLATAQANARSAQEKLINEQRRAKAIQMLHQLFLDEQKALSEQITQPLVQKVSGYLQCLFGPEARATIALEENVFASLRVARPGRETSACGFDQLSGGAREQVAAAFRLAMAEVLAEAHDGCLPLVFDDAFAFSDPDRVQTLQRMLDLAATRGLQIIVLTCNPLDYAALGAKQVTLREP